MECDTKKVRNRLKDRIDFDFWVRSLGEGRFWVGPAFGTKAKMDALVLALAGIGFHAECSGEKGTSGEFVINAYRPSSQRD